MRRYFFVYIASIVYICKKQKLYVLTTNLYWPPRRADQAA